ncbi:hypothetical protein COT29_02890 [Candidatus Micrarchaeota archaeon CG08_land_8_20_14_0_20_59_11]|nr:MAG: hypothetical protein COT29_02890 [Candidatus Micrarchaeota archaeon CG08_land_8_20_14_0_20_59_11]
MQRHASCKGQVALEFFALAGLLAVFLLLVTAASWQRRGEIEREQVAYAAEAVCSQLRSEINAAHSIGGGYSRNFNLPPMLLGSFAYEVDASYLGQERRIFVRWQGGSCGANVLASSFSGTAALVPGATVTVKNVGGVIAFET